MPSQVLALHRVSTRVFDLTGLRTGSVRDQLLRSCLVAHGLCDDGLIGPSNPLLIIGAGAAGMCAAMTAARRGVQVTVIERNKDPFTTFRLARWRRIDPVEYDWPHPHHHCGTFPMTPGWFPLEQVTGTGADLAALWAVAWDDWQRHFDGRGKNGHIEWLGSTEAKPFLDGLDYTTAGHVGVHGPWPGSGPAPSSRPFGSVVCCAGFGKERTDCSTISPDPWHGYAGPAFWLDDDSIPGAATAFPHRRVVISGGGDGAMQDLQRVATGRFGLDLLRHLRVCPALHAAGQTHDPPGKMLSGVMAEEHGRRTHAWQRTGKPPRSALEQWHRSFEIAVTTLLNGLGTALIQALAQHILRPELQHGALDITWVYQAATPGYAYALNRFLCLLIQHITLHVMAHKGLATGLVCRSEHEIANISPAKSGHRCVAPAGCVGVPHSVQLCPLAGGSPDPPLPDVTLIIIRHGAEGDPTLLKGAPVPEQMTAFDLPH